MRKGELYGLRRKDVDIPRGTLAVVRALKEVNGKGLAEEDKGMHFGEPKTRAGRRSVTLPRFLPDMLNEHLTSPPPGGNEPDDLVFTTSTGLPIRHNLFYRRHYKPAVRAALPERLHGLRFHDLRHTAASLLVAQGAHALAIKEHLGHSTITITMDRYGHLLPSAHETLADRLDAAYNEASAPPDNVRELRA